MNTLLKKLAAALIAGITALTGYHAPVVQAPVTPVVILHDALGVPLIAAHANGSLGASNVIDTPVALFASSLAAPITSSATAMTLVSGTTGDGTTLASSTYSFIIDEGQSDQEFVRANCTSTVCTNMQRGLSFVDGSTTISSLPQPHRRGQSVKITDAPLLLVLTNILNGNNGFPAPISYVSTVATTSFTSRQNIIDKGYADDLAFNGAGVINATTLAKGSTQIATQFQVASSTGTGSSGATLVIPASSATSTYNAAYAPYRVVVTNGAGTIDNNFISTSTIIFPLYHGYYVASSSGTSTFAVPAGYRYFDVTVIGGGGGGGGGTGSFYGGGGGGGGGFAEKYRLDLSATSSVQITVGAGGAGATGAATAGGQSAFGTFFSASGGSAGNGATPGTGGVGTSGDINTTGSSGGGGLSNGSSFAFGGFGGGSALGGGTTAQLTSGTGPNGGFCGGGGGGAVNITGGAQSLAGGTGAAGCVIIKY